MECTDENSGLAEQRPTPMPMAVVLQKYKSVARTEKRLRVAKTLEQDLSGAILKGHTELAEAYERQRELVETIEASVSEKHAELQQILSSSSSNSGLVGDMDSGDSITDTKVVSSDGEAQEP